MADNPNNHRVADFRIPFEIDPEVASPVGGQVTLDGKILADRVLPAKFAEELGIQVSLEPGIDSPTIIGYLSRVLSIVDDSHLIAGSDYVPLQQQLIDDIQQLLAGRIDSFDVSPPRSQDYRVNGQPVHIHFFGERYSTIGILTIKDETFLNEKKRAAEKEKEIAEERARTLEALAAEGEATAVALHDLRNGLSVLRLQACDVKGSLKEPGASPDDRSTLLVMLAAGLEKQIDVLAAQASSPLDFLRIERYELQPIQAIYFLAEAAARLQMSYSGSSGEILVVHYNPNMDHKFSVGIHRTSWFDKILPNLGKNAIEAGATEIRLDYELDGEYLRIRFSDNGTVPIPTDVEMRLFEPRVTGKDHGTGWGLPTVKKHIDLHGGSIRGYKNETLTSDQPGYTFEISLPIFKN